MATDYDTPRVLTEEEQSLPLAELAPARATALTDTIDLDEAALADAFELPGADLSGEELQVEIVPIQNDEFTCMSCFLVHHRSQLARETNGQKYCTECES
ncbi:DUF4193 domain-containing protein [Paenarthrobacter sp. NPDC091711]|uniref:DUF4193 domain-containing protein n=1 Tax=Paenarthrobacter sp. NPDC091711 TaxID=3364385 RepID=UPI003824DFE7